MAMVDPIMLLMMAAAQDPTRMGPMLDALGPTFGPNQIMPNINSLLSGLQSPSGPMTQGPAPGLDLSGGAQPDLQSTVPGMTVGTPPPGMPDLMTGASPPDSIENLLRLFATQGGMGASNPPGATSPPPGFAPPPIPLTRTPPPNVQPQVRPPTAPSPIMSGGVAGAQKAPEISVQPSAGGTPAQILLAALIGGRNQPNPLRVPTLATLLGGGS